MFKDKYKSLMDNVNAPQQLVDSIINTENKKYKFSLPKKPAVIFATLFICFFIALPVAAANSADIYRLMYMISPDVAQFFTPVQTACEDNGIKMEVVSIYEKDNEIQVCITMQDMTGDRIDGTIDLYDSYTINAPFSTGHCSFSEYDAETGKAMFIVSLEGFGNYLSFETPVKFSVRRFLSRKTHYEKVDIPFDLKSAKTATDVICADITGGGGTGLKDRCPDYATVLAPGAPLENFDVNGIDITGIGYIDGRLHIQTAVRNRKENDNHGCFWLVDETGNKILYDYSLYFENGTDTSYQDYVFDIPQDNIGFYRLQGEFWTSGLLTEGNWSVNFKV